MKPTTAPDPNVALDLIPDHVALLFTNTKALRSRYEELRRRVISAAECAYSAGYSKFDIQNARSAAGAMAIAIGEEMAKLQAVLQALEASPEFIEAEKVIAPLLEQRAKLASAKQARLDELSRKASAANAVLEKTQADLAGKALTDPAIIAARESADAAAEELRNAQSE
jgi:hypothetical protein